MFIYRKSILFIVGVIALVNLSSCNDWLDELPDNRTEIDTQEKVKDLLVSAYSVASFSMMGELMSDNVTDNGSRFTSFSKLQPECYHWEDPTDITQDTPYYLWEWSYKAIAAANYALQSIEEFNQDGSLNPQKGEALMCRAYHHFVLVNIFCHHYNTITSGTDLGIPYAEEPEEVVLQHYERGTVAAVYEKINRDIEEALPLIDDNSYPTNAVKYHFNQKASYAFAAKFNLFYLNYDKVIEYATRAIGEDPTPVLRDYKALRNISSVDDIGNLYVRSGLECNLLIMPAMSYWPYSHQGYETWYRYVYNASKNNEVLWAAGPWGSYRNLIPALKTFGGNEVVFFPKLTGFIEYTDVIAKTGYLHTINIPFTTDETLLCRAEAYIMKNDDELFNKAAKDLAYWTTSHTESGTDSLTREKINNFFEYSAGESLKPKLNPKFAINEGEQLNFIYCLLHCRRIETLHEGLRWFDIKRYGIEVTHVVDGGNDIVLTVDDPRRAVQLPDAVRVAGIEPNPR